MLGDEVRFRQVLGNLISNAIKFTHTGQVTVTAAVKGERATFTVADTGVGFDTWDTERLFRRFEQADNSNTRQFDGAGLGLTLARDLVNAMGGDLTCHSKPGAGSIFILGLPFRSAFAPEAIAPTKPEPMKAEAPARILVVDDNPTNQQVLTMMLEGAGIETMVAGNGQEAVDLWSAGAFDAVLMDIQMPVMDGLTAVRTIRAAEAARDLAATPIIMVSANAMPEHIATSLQAGANGHVAKPVTADRLFAALGGLDDGASPAPNLVANAA